MVLEILQNFKIKFDSNIYKDNLRILQKGI